MASIERVNQNLVLTCDLPPEATGAIVLPMVGETPGTPQRATVPPLPPPPDPTPTPPDLATATMLVVNGQGFAIDGANRARGSNEVIVYTKGAVADVNMWGTDVAIVGNKVTQVVARERDKIPNQTPIPAGGAVVSAHGAQGSRLAAAVKPDDAVTWRFDGVEPSPTPTPAKGALIGTYMKVWRADRVRAVSLPVGANVLHLAFARNTPGGAPALVDGGATAYGIETVRADLAQLGLGVEVGVSLGGSQGSIFFDNPSAFVDGLQRIADSIGGFTLLDLDCEQGVLNPSQVMAVDTELARRMPNVRWTAAPNGGYVNGYLPICAELSKRGRLRYHAQQFYEGPAKITADDVRWRLDQAIKTGIPADQLGIGMMVGSTYQYWTADECEAMYRIAVTEFGARHAYVWDLPRSGTAEVLARTRHYLESIP